MASEATLGEADAGGEGPEGDPRVLLFMREGRNRELLLETLGRRYGVETTTEVEALEAGYDCCIFDVHEFNRVGGTVQDKRDTGSPVSLPFVLLVGEDSDGAEDTEVWDYVDDVIHLPVRKAALLSRVGNLVDRRRTAARLAQREARLEATVRDLTLKERAMDEAPVGITIAEPGTEDDELIYANDRFEAMTGYDSNVIGSDCQFLQGEDTDPETVAEIRAALDAEEPVSVDILNYRKNGRKFWNKLDIVPIRDDAGELTHFVGFQTEITERKIRERRLEVLNRVLSHNLRNKMTVLQGHVELLRDAHDGDEESLDALERTTTDLMGIADTVRDIEETLSAEQPESVVAVGERLTQLLSGLEDRFPDVDFDLRAPAEECSVAVPGFVPALEEALENAAKHNDAPEPSVEVRVSRRDEGWVDIEVEDDGPGIPERELRVLSEGETPLNHADRLGLWLIYWVVERVGGDLSVTTGDSGGTVLTLSVPAHDPDAVG